jgi:hypothetical protein
MRTYRFGRHISPDAACEICHSLCEDSYHALMVCPHVKALRMAMRDVWELPAEERLLNVGPEWLLVLLESDKVERVANLAIILWHAWSVRNKITRAGEDLSIDSCVHYLRKLGQELASRVGVEPSGNMAQCKKGLSPRPRMGEQNSFWLPPARAGIKINVGVFNMATGEASIGIMARDHLGNPQVMVWRLITNCRDAETAEAIACRKGVQLASHWPNDVMIELESDCANLVSKVQSINTDRSVLSPIINDIKGGMLSRGACTLRKIWREQNGITHNLAKFALKSLSSQSFL